MDRFKIVSSKKIKSLIEREGPYPHFIRIEFEDFGSSLTGLRLRSNELEKNKIVILSDLEVEALLMGELKDKKNG